MHWIRRHPWQSVAAAATTVGAILLLVFAYTNYMSDYTRARNLLLHKVSHVEPVWESDPRVLFEAFEGVPKVEQVSVLVDHIGPFDDGDYVFCTNELTRQWQLQRRDGGPWRIASRNGL